MVTADTLMVALLGAFVTFSVFAGAFLAFLTGGDGLKKIADYWIARGAREDSASTPAGTRPAMNTRHCRVCPICASTRPTIPS